MEHLFTAQLLEDKHKDFALSWAFSSKMGYNLDTLITSLSTPKVIDSDEAQSQFH